MGKIQRLKFDSIKQGSNVLLLNPPISDTIEAEEMNMIASVEPFGLLRLGTYFRNLRCKVQYLDALRDPSLNCVLRRHVRKILPCGNPDEGKNKEIYHFGLTKELLRNRLKEFEKPDIIAITSVFTWHIDALKEAIQACKEVYPKAQVILGGNFPTVCAEEAQKTSADIIFVGDIEGAQFLPTAVDLLPNSTEIDYLRMIKGCPYKCNYCITNLLNNGKVFVRNPEEVYEEMLEKIKKNNTKTFIFYDDFILYRQKHYLDPFLDIVIEEKLKVRLEFPLGFSAHMITEKFISRMWKAGVEQITIALETINEQRSRYMKRPHHIREFIKAVEILKSHGYRGKNIRVFFLMGLPDQTIDEILKGILFLYHLELMPSLTTYTITPGSGDMALYGSRIKWSSLDELTPLLWKFAHGGMKVRDLDAVYRYFHEKYYPLGRIMCSDTDDLIILKMQKIIENKTYLPENW